MDLDDKERRQAITLKVERGYLSRSVATDEQRQADALEFIAMALGEAVSSLQRIATEVNQIRQKLS